MQTTNRMVRLKSTSTSTVVVSQPSYGIRRVFPNKGSVQAIPFEIMEQLLWSEGFRNLINTGILYIDNMQDKIDLGLEDEGTTQPTRIKIFTDEQILTLLKIKSFDDFRKELATVTIDQAHAVVDYAVKNQIIDSQKVDYLKEITGRDVIKIIARKKEEAEAEKAAAAKEALRREAQ